MKVVYEKKMTERLHDAVEQAEKEGRKVQHIELTDPELRQLLLEVYHPLLDGPKAFATCWKDFGDKWFMIYGIRCVEQK